MALQNVPILDHRRQGLELHGFWEGTILGLCKHSRLQNGITFGFEQKKKKRSRRARGPVFPVSEDVKEELWGRNKRSHHTIEKAKMDSPRAPRKQCHFAYSLILAQWNSSLTANLYWYRQYRFVIYKIIPFQGEHKIQLKSLKVGHTWCWLSEK